MLITAVELVRLQLHSAFPLRQSTLVQLAPGIAWIGREVFPQPLNLQSHKPETGIARREGALNALLGKDIIDRDIGSFLITERFFRLWIQAVQAL